MTPTEEAAHVLALAGIESDGDLVSHSPIDGHPIGRVAVGDPDQAAARASEAFCQWRKVPAPRRGELVRLLGEELRAAQGATWPAGHARGRQDRPGEPGRSAGDDRHLRLRGRPVAPALWPHHRQRTPRSPHDGEMASARRGRRDHAPSTSPSRSGPGTRRWRWSAAIRWSGSRRRRRR